MSGLASVARGLGAKVSGSDSQSSVTTEQLKQIGVEVSVGHNADNVPDSSDVIYSTAVPSSNPERQKAQQLGLNQLHRSDLLAELCALKRCIAVTGTHGKTTTTSMITHTLREAGLSPSYLIGGKLTSTGLNAEWSDGDWVVVEADESDRSLLRLKPEIAVVTNAEVDHHETYGSGLDLYKTLVEFCKQSEKVIVGQQSSLQGLPNVEVATQVDGSKVEATSKGMLFLYRGNQVEIPLTGSHNVQNAALAIEVATAVGIDQRTAAAALTSFKGAGRRFEYIGKGPHGAELYDDYAHHPTEVAATLEAAKLLKFKRVVAVFQPHLYSRTKAFRSDFGRALSIADLVVVCDIFPARESAKDYPGVTGKQIATAAAEAGSGLPVVWLPDFSSLTNYLKSELSAGDICLTLGAGNVRDVAEALLIGS